MARLLNFFKMEASGNDFIVIDNRKKAVKDPRRFTRKVCASHTSVGADGVLLLEASRKAAFKMRIINADGSEAEACGNGFRCIALFAHKKLGLPSRFKFQTGAGIVEAGIRGRKVRVLMTQPKDSHENELQVAGNRLHYSFINTGVPHAVIFVHGLDKVDVLKLGRAVREHAAFKPKGTNVNFVEVTGLRAIRVRTYERGVEQETLACGTGSTAAAIISALMGYAKPPVRVKTTGGETLIIDFKISGKKVSDVFLEGDARFVYEGKMLSPVS